ncbi:deoxyribodipyrimidine photo-lyase [Litoribacillus peritrichatus]
MTVMVWFKRDLRVYDNPALTEAMKEGPVIAVYVLSHEQWDKHDVSPAQRALIVGQLHSLEKKLAELNVPLLVKVGDCFDSVPGTLARLIKEYSVTSLYFNREYEVNERRCESAVEQSVKLLGAEVFAFHDACMVVPGSVLSLKGEPYKVFSAFKKAFIAGYGFKARPVAYFPGSQPVIDVSSDLTELQCIGYDSEWLQQWPAGEAEAHDRLERFMDVASRDYKATRDIPGVPGTSQLSPYLAVGALSTTQCMTTALMANEGLLDGGNEGIACWINELIWREFYRHVLFHNPEVSMNQPLKKETDLLPWRNDQADFQRWCDGNTGFPIIDAAMKQLVTTGWMHNRLRMITAMFLTKNLFIDWRLGEQFFMRHLVDGDLASNNGGWQWCASTGVDAAPYFRIFNPVSQSKRFDPDGTFIRKFLPQLASLNAKDIHQPSLAQAKKLNYPEPMVNLSESAGRTKLLFKNLTQPTVPDEVRVG